MTNVSQVDADMVDSTINSISLQSNTFGQSAATSQGKEGYIIGLYSSCT